MASTQIRRLAAKVAGTAVSAVLVFMLVFAVLMVVFGFLARPGKDGVSRLDGHPVLTVLSGSMRPVFDPGDMVIDKPVTPDQASRLKPGDIVTFHVPGSATSLITHRIYAVQHSPAGAANGHVAYETKGDANNAPDIGLVSPDQIIGTYSERVPFAGYLLQAIQHKLVFGLLIFLPLLYLVVTEIAKRWHEPEPASKTNALHDGDDKRDLKPAEFATAETASQASNPKLVALTEGRVRMTGVTSAAHLHAIQRDRHDRARAAGHEREGGSQRVEIEK